jgi:hypothetical protein
MAKQNPDTHRISVPQDAPQSMPRTVPSRVPLLDQVNLEHGPSALIGRFILKAEHAARRRGVTLSIEPISALGTFTREHLPTWPPLPMFDPADGAFADDRAFCIMGRDAAGAIVATQAVRAYAWPTSTLRDEAAGLSLFYGQGHPPEGAHCRVSAASAAVITGTVAYSGGGWYAPPFRGHELSAILPRLSRTLALAQWATDFTVSFVDWQLVRKGVVARYGYKNVDDGVRIEGMIGDAFDAALVWMDRTGLIDDLDGFIETFDGTSSSVAQD